MPTTNGFRVLWECTPSAQSAEARGIPRVVRNIVRHGTMAAADQQGKALAVRYVYGRWREVRLTDTPRGFDQVREAPRLSDRIAKLLPSAALRRAIAPPPGRDGVWKIPRRIWRESRRLAEYCREPPIVPGESDVLVILDPWWRCPDRFWRSVAQVRRRGALVGTVIYDLIPITHSEFVGARHTKRFESWLHQAARQTDFFMAISGTVKEQLRAYLRESVPNQSWNNDRFHSFMLGADLPKRKGGEIRPDVREAFSGGRTYLMVGALERRKNQPFLLDTFERLWERNVDVRLCLVGSFTRAMPEFYDRMKAHVEWGRRLFYFSDLGDGELEYCYRHSCSLVYPSIVEGFGLPIVEALQYGKSVLASNTPIHREVGGQYCQYFDLEKCESLVKMIAARQRQIDGPEVESADRFQAPTWSQSSQELVSICRQHWDKAPRTQHLIRRAA